jgi:predicted dinucleotide-binding enzyme
MRIGIIGPGEMGEALGRQWVRLGHSVVVAGRSPDKARALAERLGPKARAGTLAEAVAFGETVLIAVRYEGLLQTLVSAGAREGTFIGKTLVDCNNPVEINTFAPVTQGGQSMSEAIALTARGAAVVKAFHLCHASVWKMVPPAFDGRPLSVPLCGDYDDAKAVVADLITAMGCRPVDLGPLSQARNLEAMAAVIIKLLFAGAEPTSNFNLVNAVR